jgi:hypothetical protein
VKRVHPGRGAPTRVVVVLGHVEAVDGAQAGPVRGAQHQQPRAVQRHQQVPAARGGRRQARAEGQRGGVGGCPSGGRTFVGCWRGRMGPAVGGCTWLLAVVVARAWLLAIHLRQS